MIPIITPIELSREIESSGKPYLLDVREPFELEISSLDIDANIPMSQIPMRISELDKSADIVVICRSGNRSGRVTEYLLQSGFERVRNLSSGMNGWSTDVDPAVKRY